MKPAPYPADTRAKGWRFEIDTERIRQSDTWALAPPDMRPWLLMLWMVAWEQTPCGSLPGDDPLIAARLGMPLKTFAKHRPVLMRGWYPADDGRLYHPVIVERVREMSGARQKTADRKSLYDKKFYAIRDRDGGACVYCAETTYLSLDHLIAVSRGGGGEDSNLVTACRSCNSVKGARTPDEAGLTFVNKSAETLWHAIRDAGNAGTVTRSKKVTRHGRSVTREERAADDTGTGTGTGTNKEKETPPPSPPPDDPPELAGGSAEDEKPTPTPAGALCRAMRAAGIADVNPGHPDLLALIAAGVTEAEVVGAATAAAKNRSGFPYALAILVRQRREAAEKLAAMHKGPLPGSPEATPWYETAGGVKAKGAELGIPYTSADECNVFGVYKARVIAAAGPRHRAATA